MSTDDELGDPPASINPYEVLEIGEKASADEVKSAYRKKALKHHPGRQDYPLHVGENTLITAQTRPRPKQETQPKRSFSKSHSHTLFYPTSVAAADTILPATHPNHSIWRMTILTGHSSTKNNSRGWLIPPL